MRDPIVDFLIIGAAKCGTTTLASIISEHPEVCFSKIKEPAFFNYEANMNSHAFERYHHLFENRNQYKIAGEASTYYSDYPEYTNCAKRIYSYNPDMKLIYIIRNPIDRIRSNYKHHFANGITSYHRSKMFEEIQLDQRYINRSKYFMQIQQYLEFFPPHQICVVLFEDFIKNPQSVVSCITNFLSITPITLSNELLLRHKNNSNELVHYNPIFKVLSNTDLSTLLSVNIKVKLRRIILGKIPEFQHFSKNQENWIWQKLNPDYELLNQFIQSDVHKLWRTPTHS